MDKDHFINVLNKIVDRREFLCRNVPNCNFCGEDKQIQLIDHSEVSVHWKCRKCKITWGSTNMYSYIQSLKDNLDSNQRRRGNNSVLLDSQPLRELIRDYERLDSELRFRHIEEIPFTPPEEILRACLLALYHKDNKEVDNILLLIMDILTPLLLEKKKEANLYQGRDK